MTEPLPPVPDVSGEPRPPTAPRVTGPWHGERYQLHVIHHAVADQLFVAATRLEHPLLEVATARRPDRWRNAALATGISVLPVTVVLAIVLAFTVADLVRAYLILAAVLLAVSPFAFWRHSLDTVVVLQAGAHRVAELDTDGDGLDLPLYELRSISVVDSRRGLSVRVVGPNKQPLVLPFGLLEANQRLWDLVYNGLRHSAAKGAQVDARTRELLNLPQPATNIPDAT